MRWRELVGELERVAVAGGKPAAGTSRGPAVVDRRLSSATEGRRPATGLIDRYGTKDRQIANGRYNPHTPYRPKTRYGPQNPQGLPKSKHLDPQAGAKPDHVGQGLELVAFKWVDPGLGRDPSDRVDLH